MLHEERIIGKRYRANEHGTMVEVTSDGDSTFVVVAGDARATLRAEIGRVRRGRGWVSLPRAAVAILGGLVVLELLRFLEPHLLPIFDTWLGPLSFIAGFAFVVPAVFLGAGAALATTSGWPNRWTPSFDGIEIEGWVGHDLFTHLTPDDRDRLLATKDASPDVQEAAQRLLSDAYQAALKRKHELERQATDEAPSRNRAEARRLLGLPSTAARASDQPKERARRGLRLRRR